MTPTTGPADDDAGRRVAATPVRATTTMPTTPPTTTPASRSRPTRRPISRRPERRGGRRRRSGPWRSRRRRGPPSSAAAGRARDRPDPPRARRLFLLFSVGHRPVDRRAVVRTASASTASSGRGSARRSGCSSGALLVALVVLLGNLLAGRPAAPPPSDPERPGRLRSMVDRLNEAQRQAGRRPSRRRPVAVRRQRDRSAASGDAIAVAFESERHARPRAARDLDPRGASRVLLALGIAGAVSRRLGDASCCGSIASRSRRPQSVTDPIFGRDISFFLFELPFLRSSRRCSTGSSRRRCCGRGRRYLVSASQRRARLHHAGPRPPGGPRRAVPAVGRVRLPARQVRARLQHPRRRDRRRATRTRTRSSSPTTC